MILNIVKKNEMEEFYMVVKPTKTSIMEVIEMDLPIELAEKKAKDYNNHYGTGIYTIQLQKHGKMQF
jgi:hypothetical protein